MKPISLAAASVAVMLAASQGAAQDHTGFTSGSPMVVILDGDRTPRTKGPGFSTFEAMPRIPGRPDFRSLPPLLANAQILSMSIGMETINVLAPNTNPTVAFPLIDPEHGWIALLYATNPGDAGPLTPDSVLEKEGERSELGGSLFSFLMPGSSLELLSQEDEATLAMSASTTGLDNEAILAVDFHMALYGLDPEFLSSTALTRPLPDEPTFYFTLEPPFPSSVLPWYGAPANESGATILQTTWNKTSRTWSIPTVWKLWSEFEAVARTNRIDGLAIDDGGDPNSGSVELLYSLDGSESVDDQLIYSRVGERTGTNGTIRKRRYSVPNGGGPVPVPRRVGSGRSLGGTCVVDPIGIQIPASDRRIDEFAIARRDPVDPSGPLGSVPLALAPSGYRDWVPPRVPGSRGGFPTFMTFMNGPKTSGTAVVSFFVQTFGTTLSGELGWIDQPVLTTRRIRYRGHPISASIPIPTRAGPCSALGGPSEPSTRSGLFGCERIVAQWHLEEGATVASPSTITHAAPRCVIYR